MVLPDREADWRLIQESVFGKIKDIFRAEDEDEEQKAPSKRTYEQVKACFKQSMSFMIQNLLIDEESEILG